MLYNIGDKVKLCRNSDFGGHFYKKSGVIVEILSLGNFTVLVEEGVESAKIDSEYSLQIRHFLECTPQNVIKGIN